MRDSEIVRPPYGRSHDKVLTITLVAEEVLRWQEGGECTAREDPGVLADSITQDESRCSLGLSSGLNLHRSGM